MPEFVLPLVCAIAVGVVLYYGPKVFDRRTQALRVALADMDAAHDAARRLLKDEAVDPVLVPLIRLFAARAGRPWLARRIARDVLTGRFEQMREAPPTAHQRALKAALHRLRADQVELFAELVTRSITSSAAADPLVGRLSLRALVFGFDRTRGKVANDSAEAIALDLSPRTMDCAAAA